MNNYIKSLKHYKYQGILLLEALVKYIKTFFSFKCEDYDLNRCYNIMGMLRIDKIFNLKNDSFDEENKYMINDYTLKLLKLYYDICQFVINKHKIYNKNKNNKIFMRKKKRKY